MIWEEDIAVATRPAGVLGGAVSDGEDRVRITTVGWEPAAVII